MQVSEAIEEVKKLLDDISITGDAQLLLDKVKANPELIPTVVKSWIESKPWRHLYEPVLVCAQHSPTSLKLIIRDKLEGGGKITYSVFGKKPDQVEHYFDVYPLDILLYATRIDMMNYDELEPLTNSVFLGRIAVMPEFAKFREAVKDFTS